MEGLNTVRILRTALQENGMLVLDQKRTFYMPFLSVGKSNMTIWWCVNCDGVNELPRMVGKQKAEITNKLPLSYSPFLVFFCTYCFWAFAHSRG